MSRDAQQILAAVSTAWGVSRGEIKSDRRNRRTAYPRFAASLMMRHERALSYTVIGRLLGGRDHSTILKGVARAHGLLAADPDFAARYEEAKAG